MYSANLCLYIQLVDVTHNIHYFLLVYSIYVCCARVCMCTLSQPLCGPYIQLSRAFVSGKAGVVQSVVAKFQDIYTKVSIIIVMVTIGCCCILSCFIELIAWRRTAMQV